MYRDIIVNGPVCVALTVMISSVSVHPIGAQLKEEVKTTHPDTRSIPPEESAANTAGNVPRPSVSGNCGQRRGNTGAEVLLDSAERHYESDRREDALEAATCAVVQMNAGPRIAEPRAALVLGRVAELLRRLGRYDDAEAHLRRARILWYSAGDCEEEAVCLNNMAVLYIEQGRLHAARAVLATALATLRTCDGTQRAREWAFSNTQGSLEFLAGDYKRAATHFERALRLHTQNGSSPLERATLLNNLAVAYADRGQSGKAGALVAEMSSLAVGTSGAAGEKIRELLKEYKNAGRTSRSLR